MWKECLKKCRAKKRTNEEKEKRQGIEGREEISGWKKRP